MDEGIALMELATRAADLFEEQSASEKRRLLEFVLSDSIWASGELTPVFRQPFDMLADMATVGAQKMAAGELSSSHHQVQPFTLRPAHLAAADFRNRDRSASGSWLASLPLMK